MATWKKVLVSGSSANLATLQVDNLTNGQVVIGGGSSNLTTTAINGTGNIVATSGATGLSASGSFSGSFQGNFTGTSSFATTAGTANQVQNALSQGVGITTFSYNGSSAQTVAVSGASSLSSNAITKWTGNAFANSSLTDNGTVISGNSSLQLTGANSSLTGSFAGTFSGSVTAVITNANTSSVIAVTNTTTGTTYFPTFTTGAGSGQTLFIDTASGALSFNATTNTLTTTASVAISASNATTASFAQTAGQLVNALIPQGGLSGSAASYNGSVEVSFSVGAGPLIQVNDDSVQVATSSLTTNQLPKYSANALVGSNITDTGTQVQIDVGASSGLSVAAGGINVTGNSTFNNNLSVVGDLTVAGTASFQNTQNLLIGDRFAALASGSTTLTDGGIIIVSSTTANGMSGSAWYLESTNTNSYGRFAVAYNVNVSASTATADEYAVTAKISQASNPVDATPPTWGGSANGMGNMWITTAGDIFIYA